MTLTAEAKRQRKLTKELWKKDPAWFRRALAYRLLWILLHPALSRLLPRGLFVKVFATGSPWDPATFSYNNGFPIAFPPGYYPPGVGTLTPYGTRPESMPPGYYPPGVGTLTPYGTRPESMPPGYYPPGVVTPTPDGTRPESLPPGYYPPGVVTPTPDGTRPESMPPGYYPPGVVTPTPDGTRPESLPPGYYPPGVVTPTPDGTRPESLPPGWPGDGSPIPPITNLPWTPGPPHSYSGCGSATADIGELLRQQWPGDQGFDVGNDSLQVRLANIAGVDATGNVAAVKIKVGKSGAPLDNVSLAFYSTDGDGKPNTVITGGTSTTISGAVLPLFSVDQDFIIFYFPSRPLLELGTDYYLAVQRSGSVDAGDYYVAFGFGFRWGSSYYQDIAGTWGDKLGQHFDYEIWGFPV